MKWRVANTLHFACQVADSPTMQRLENVLKIELLSLNPIFYKQCQQCETFFDQAGIAAKVQVEMVSRYPVEIERDQEQLAAVLANIVQKYPDRIAIRVIDPQSPIGFYKSLRHWVRSYPTFIIDGKQVITGANQADLDQAIQMALVQG